MVGLGLVSVACGDDATSTSASAETSTGAEPSSESTADPESSTGDSGDGGGTATGSTGRDPDGGSTDGESSSGGGTSGSSGVMTTVGDATDTETTGGDTTDTGTTGAASLCGNGEVDEDEICDDGNDINADGCNVDCQASCTELWSDNSIGAMDAQGDALWALAVDGAGNVVATGRRPTATESWNIWLVKFDPDGNLLWQQDIDALGGYDEGHGIDTDSQDNIVVTGYVTGSGAGHFLHAYDPDGALIWSDEPDPGPTAGSWGYDVAVGADDQIVAVGTRNEDGAGYSIWMRAYDSDGGIAWTEQVPQSIAGTDNRAQAVTLDDDGTIYVGGLEGVNGSNSRAWLRRYDAEGNAGWTVTREGGANGMNAYRGLALAADGDVIAVGVGSVPGEGQSALFDRYDPDGNVVALSEIGGDGDDGAFDVVVDGDGNISIAGYDSSQTWLVKYDPEGQGPWWSKTYDNGAFFESFTSVDVDADDNLVVGGGWFFGGFDFSLWVAKITP